MDNFKSWNDPSLLFSFAFLFCFLKIYRIVNFFGKIYWSMNSGGLLGISKKIISIFKPGQKIITKLGQFKKLKCPNFVNCPNFVTIFCCVLKMKFIFFYIPSYPPPIAVRNSVTNQFFQKNWQFCIFSTKKKFMQNWREEKGPGTLVFSSVLHNFFLLLKIYKIVNFFGKIDWSMNSGPRWSGDS